MARGTSERKTYLNVMGGKIVSRVDANTPNAVHRTNKLGNDVYELKEDWVSGKITGLTIRTHEEYGDDLVLTVDDGHETCALQMPIRSGYSKGFLTRMMNVDYTKEVKFKPFLFHEDGKDKHRLVIYQGVDATGKDIKVENFFTKETPNGLPEFEQVKFKGELRWDDTKQMNFYKKVIEEKIIPKITEATSDNFDGGHSFEEEVEEPVIESKKPKANKPAKVEAEENMDLPF